MLQLLKISEPEHFLGKVLLLLSTVFDVATEGNAAVHLNSVLYIFIYDCTRCQFGKEILSLTRGLLLKGDKYMHSTLDNSNKFFLF